MTPAAEGTSPRLRRGGGISRIAGIGALILAVVAVAFLVLGGDGGGHKYRLLFETGGQLVPGNQVLIGGAPAGSVDEVELRDDAQAEVTITMDEPLNEGTTAVIRQTSLSGIANRYVSVTPGPDNLPELGDNALITQVDTTTPVDLDELFNALREPERKALQNIIQGSATVYTGREKEANETYKYLSPSLTATDRLIREINRDERVLTDFLVSGSRVVTSVAERRDDLVGLVSNGNEALGAIAEQNRALNRALVALPPTLRQANTTFSNLRLALDDLDPLVETAKPATKNLAPFLRQLQPVVRRSIPVFKDLRLAVNRKGKANDLADAMADLPPLRNNANDAVEPAVAAMQDADPVLQFLRPYAPDLFTGVSQLNRVSAYYDADGHYTRVSPASLGIFTYNPGTQQLDPAPSSAQFADFGPGNLGVFRRCPGGPTQPIAGSNPFAAPPFTGQPIGAPPTPGDCDASDVLPGP